jgi:peptidoglycan/LPS O-acetylase OafA/YrhL
MSSEHQGSWVILDHLRWLSASAVALSHVRNHLMVDFADIKDPSLFAKAFYFFTGYGHIAVVVFFVISGFLVGGNLLKTASSPQFYIEWSDFIVDRISRIFIVLWPALVLSALVLGFTELVAPSVPFAASVHWDSSWAEPIKSDLDATKWLYCALLINEIVGKTILLDNPLWSLSYEWAYYMLSLSLLLIFRRVYTKGSRIFIVYTCALLLLVALNKPIVLWGGVVWSAGLLARVVLNRGYIKGRLVFAGSLAIAVATLAVARVRPVDDLVVGVSVALLLAHSRWRTWGAARRLGHTLAGFSYSLYVTHCPFFALLMVSAQRIDLVQHRLSYSLASVTVAIGCWVLLMVLARSFAYLTEDRTATLRRWWRQSFPQAHKTMPPLATNCPDSGGIGQVARVSTCPILPLGDQYVPQVKATQQSED